MAITLREKELAAVGISVATGCKPCTDFHVKKVREAGASDSEVRQAMSDAFAVRRDATEIMEAYGLAHVGAGKNLTETGSLTSTDRGVVTFTRTYWSGDINDPNSRVSQLKKSPLNYSLLAELNTKPRTTYLAVVRNPNTELEPTPAAAEHGEAHGVERVAGGKAVTVERRRGAADGRMRDERTLAHGVALDELVGGEAGEPCDREVRRDEPAAGEQELREDQCVPEPAVPEAADDVEERARRWQAARAVEQATETELRPVEMRERGGESRAHGATVRPARCSSVKVR